MSDIMLPEQYLEMLKEAIVQKKGELEQLEQAYAKINQALACESSDKNAEKAKKEATRQKLAEAQRRHHKKRRKEIADKIIKKIPDWKHYEKWELAQKIGATLDAINKIFEEDERFKI